MNIYTGSIIGIIIFTIIILIVLYFLWTKPQSKMSSNGKMVCDNNKAIPILLIFLGIIDYIGYYIYKIHDISFFHKLNQLIDYKLDYGRTPYYEINKYILQKYYYLDILN